MQTAKQNDHINSGSCTINSPCPWERLSSRLVSGGISPGDMTPLWRAFCCLPLFLLARSSSSAEQQSVCEMQNPSRCAELLRPRVLAMAMTHPPQSAAGRKSCAVHRAVNTSRALSADPSSYFVVAMGSWGRQHGQAQTVRGAACRRGGKF